MKYYIYALEHSGCEVLAVDNVDDAITFAKRDRDKIRLVILDVMMAPGDAYADLETKGLKTGSFLYNDLAHLCREAAIVVLTNLSTTQALRSFPDDDRLAVLEKLSVRPFELVQIVKKKLDEQAKNLATKGRRVGLASVESIKGMVDIGIITMRRDEFLAVLERLQARRTIGGEKRLYEYAEVPTSDGAVCRVAVTRGLEQGEGPAQALARDFIDELAPRWMLLVGIAGGLPDDEFGLGDVLLASRLHDFSVSAALESESPQQSLTGGPMHPDVEQLLAHIPALEDNFKGWNSRDAIRRDKPVVRVP